MTKITAAERLSLQTMPLSKSRKRRVEAELTDKNGVKLSFDWPTGPGERDRTVSLRLTDGPMSVAFALDMRACDYIIQRLRHVQEAPNRGRKFEG